VAVVIVGYLVFAGVGIFGPFLNTAAPQAPLPINRVGKCWADARKELKNHSLPAFAPSLCTQRFADQPYQCDAN